MRLEVFIQDQRLHIKQTLAEESCAVRFSSRLSVGIMSLQNTLPDDVERRGGAFAV